MEPVPASSIPPAAPASPEPRLRLSKIVLYAMLAIAVVVIAAIFGFILVYVAGLTHQLWWMGFTSLIFAFIWYLVYMGSHNRTIAYPLAAAFFVVGIGSFYGSIGSDTASDPLNKLVLIVLESIFVVIVLTAIWTMSRQSEEERVRKSQRKVTP